MGWKSTMVISREAAIKAIKDYVEHAKDKDIFLALECLLGEKCGYNFAYFKDEQLEDDALESLLWAMKGD